MVRGQPLQRGTQALLAYPKGRPLPEIGIYQYHHRIHIMSQ